MKSQRVYPLALSPWNSESGSIRVGFGSLTPRTGEPHPVDTPEGADGR